MNDFTEITTDELAQVSGGSSGLFGFFDDLFKGFVFDYGGKVGGDRLAEKMYGRHVTARDRSRAQAAMTKFLHDGHKLPKGVPNIFG